MQYSREAERADTIYIRTCIRTLDRFCCYTTRHQRADRNRVYAVYIAELAQTHSPISTHTHKRTYPWQIGQLARAISNRCGVECSAAARQRPQQMPILLQRSVHCSQHLVCCTGPGLCRCFHASSYIRHDGDYNSKRPRVDPDGRWR